MTAKKTSCDCCGTCCRKGGPALHIEDYDLIESGVLSIGELITVRQGEYVYHPLADDPLPARHEFVKIRGKGADWCCIFLDEAQSACSIYSSRPVACRLLKCWDPEDILAIMEKNLLDRLTLVPVTDPLSELIRTHEQECPVTLLNSLVDQLQVAGKQDKALAELNRLVNIDLKARGHAAKTYRLTLESELFYFGRPLFQLLIPLGITVNETPEGIQLQFRHS